MDTIVLASDSMMALDSCIQVAVSIIAVLGTAAGAVATMFKLSPLSPSEELGTTPMEHTESALYVLTQLKLTELRAQRKALLEQSDKATRKVDNDLATQIDPVRITVVGGVEQRMTLVVGSY